MTTNTTTTNRLRGGIGKRASKLPALPAQSLYKDYRELEYAMGKLRREKERAVEKWLEGLDAFAAEQKERIAEKGKERFMEKVKDAVTTYKEFNLEDDKSITCNICNRSSFDLSTGKNLNSQKFPFPSRLEYPQVTLRFSFQGSPPC